MNFTTRIMTGITIMLALYNNVPAQAQSKDALKHFKETHLTYTGGEYKDEVFKYRLMEPETLEKDVFYPVIIFLHGAGERGTDNKAQLKYFCEEMAKPENRKKFPCYIIAPQCRKNKRWVEVSWSDKKSTKLAKEPGDQMAVALEIIDLEIRRLPQVDYKRIYLTGLSMGGYGSWELAMRTPKRFAAVAPICGGGDETNAKLIAHLPIQVWHGDKDGAVPVVRSRTMVEALKKAGGNPVYVELKGAGHNVWTPAYTRKDGVIPWLFKQKQK